MCICASAGFLSSRTPRPQHGAAQSGRDMYAFTCLATVWNNARLSRTDVKAQIHGGAAGDGMKSPQW